MRHYAMAERPTAVREYREKRGLSTGALVRDVTALEPGQYVVEVHLQRSSHEDAVNEILIALEQLGYSWVQARVTEWVDRTIGGFIVGGLGLGAAGTSTGSGDASALL